MKDKSIQFHELLNGSRKWLVSGLVGIGTGLAKFITDVRQEFHDNVIKGPDFKTKLEQHGGELGKIKQSHRLNEIDTQTFTKKFSGQKNHFTKQINEFAEELGIHSTGLRGFAEGSIQRFQTLSSNPRAPLVFSAVATTVIGFAGTSMFLNSIITRRSIKDIATHHPNSETDNASRSR